MEQENAQLQSDITDKDNSYSLELVDTIFADTLSRGMQNAIVSQQNAQMASSSSVTNACARILQAQSKKSVNSGKSTLAPMEPSSPSLEPKSKQSEGHARTSNKGTVMISALAILVSVALVAGALTRFPAHNNQMASEEVNSNEQQTVK